MDTWRSILGMAALAGVYAAYVPWVAKRLDHTRRPLTSDRDRFLLFVPIVLAAVAVGVALDSWDAMERLADP